MKRIYYIACFLLLYNCSKKEIIQESTTNNNFAETITVKTLGGTNNETLNSVVKTADGGYAVLGFTQSNNFDINTKNNESFDFWVMKFSSEDILIWSKTFGGTDDDRGADIIATNDGGFALLGYSKSNDGNVTTNAGSQDFWVIKITADGNITWQKTFGFSGADYGTTLLQTSDNGFLLTGVLDVTASGGQGNSKTSNKHAGGDIWAIKLNNSGTLEWSKFYGGSFTDTPFGIVETTDNNYIIAASSDSEDFNISNNKGTYDFWILKISADGALIWEQSFGGSQIDEPRAITATDDGNFIVIGDTRSFDIDVAINNGAADLWMIKISNEGTLIWEKTIGSTSFDVARSISKTQDNGFVIAGSSRSSDSIFSNQGQNDAWVLKVDDSANIVWQKFIGGTEIDFLYDAIELNNKTIISVGESSSFNGDITENKGFSDALIINIK
ncbi:hypothetical protein [uncultured Polaribacter sp.]|uniref:hypothetical protein n=1 Tax=uncultured Polaribacter sp. TaxID=174711 RepID=UPI00260667A9|nr:hypothetical protein [uncultured Polaribacter sp.]